MRSPPFHAATSSVVKLNTVDTFLLYTKKDNNSHTSREGAAAGTFRRAVLLRQR